MTSNHICHTSLETLERLQALAPDPRRAERVRARCRTQLGRSRQRTARIVTMTALARRVLASVVVASFCVLYLAALLTTTLRLYGVFR